MSDQIELVCAEIQEERAGICEFDGLMTRKDAERMGMLESDAYRMACEVRTVLGWSLTKRRDYLDMAEKIRGAHAVGELREAVRLEWLRRKTETAGQA